MIADLIAIVAPRVGRLVLALAGTLLVLTLLVVALGYHVATWPLRRHPGSGSNRDAIQALLAVGSAVVVLVAVLQARKARRLPPA